MGLAWMVAAAVVALLASWAFNTLVYLVWRPYTITKEEFYGATVCARATSLLHADLLLELGHCLQNGYGVRRFLVQTNVCEPAAAVTASASLLVCAGIGGKASSARQQACLLSEFGCRAVLAANATGEATHARGEPVSQANLKNGHMVPACDSTNQ